MNHSDTKQQIINTVAKLGKGSVTDIIKNLPKKKSRQWVSSLLNGLIKENLLARSKSGKFVFYVLPDRLDLLGKKISKTLSTKNLDEDLVFDEFNTQAHFLSNLNESIHSILEYAFTKILNNVIEHSQAEKTKVLIEEANNKLSFEISDKGIGVFKNIMQKKHLKGELEAIQELLKGKTTTLPHSHSGEGIFFTSKVADLFILDSFEYRMRVDNKINDIFIEKIKPFLGTRVRFEIEKNSKKHLNDVFREYESEPGSFDFGKTRVYVKLFKAGTVYISRSQAKRLMSSLDKFVLIILDFAGIDTVGQAFCDEVFRVFATKHSDIKIEPINMTETVRFMVNRTQKPQLSSNKKS